MAEVRKCSSEWQKPSKILHGNVFCQWSWTNILMIRIVDRWIIANISTSLITWYLTVRKPLRDRYYLHLTGEETEAYPNHAALEVSVWPQSQLSQLLAHPPYGQNRPRQLPALQNLPYVTPPDQKHSSLLIGPPIFPGILSIPSPYTSIWASRT